MSMKKHLWPAAVGVLAACATAASAEAPITIRIEHFAFVPAELTVKAGAKVAFVNHDEVAHSVIGTEGEFRSNALAKSESFVTTLAKPGVVAYFCGLHGDMRGKITVAP
jgi:plastocyanin